MSMICQIHDRWLLWFVQEVFYANLYLTLPVMFFAAVCMPTHRRGGLFVSWLATLWSLMCLVFYNAWGEAPLLAWFLVCLLLYQMLRWICWLLARGITARPLATWPSWLRPRTAWASAIVRDYFRNDPRGVYWLDLARAVRGQEIARSAADRRAAVVISDECPAWRRGLWRQIFRLMEVRIRLFVGLPKYWHRPHKQLGLDEYHIQSVLQQEAARARQEMLLHWTGHNFQEYFERSLVSRRQHGEAAAKLGRKYCWHREAIVEHQTFRSGWARDELGLLQAAWESYLTWRDRRQYDALWIGDRFCAEEAAAETAEVPVEESPPARAEENGTVAQDAQPAADEQAGLTVGPTEEQAADDTYQDSETDSPDRFVVEPHQFDPNASESHDEDSLAGHDRLQDSPPDESPEDEASGPSEDDRSRVGGANLDLEIDVPQSSAPLEAGDTDASQASEDNGHDVEIADDEDDAPEAAAGEQSGLVEMEDDQDETGFFEDAGAAGPAPDDSQNGEDHVDSDDADLFAASTSPDEAAEKEQATDLDADPAHVRSERQRGRRSDLQTASRLLGAYLGIPATGDFEREVRTVERFLVQAKRARAALILLMIYCLRKDHTGRDVDRLKVDVLNRLAERYVAGRPSDKREKELRRLFRIMYLDVLWERGEFSHVVEFFSGRESELGPYERKSLADARAWLARSLTDQEELRDMLRYDAINLYFEAGFCPVWTLEYAQVLFDNIRGTRDLDKLFKDYPVDIEAASHTVVGTKKRRGGPPPIKKVPIRKVLIDVRDADNPQAHKRVELPRLPITLGNVKQYANLRVASNSKVPVLIEFLLHDNSLAAKDLTKKTGLKKNGGNHVGACFLKKGDILRSGRVVVEVCDIHRSRS